MRFLAIFMSLVHRVDLMLHILIELSGVHDFAIVSPMLDHSNITKMPFWMIQIAKNEVFGHFLEFGASDWLDIAYYDRLNWCAWFGHHITLAGSFKNHKNAILNDPNSQKRGFRSFSWVWSIELTWYCINEIELNGVHELAIISAMLDHSKVIELASWMIQIVKN